MSLFDRYAIGEIVKFTVFRYDSPRYDPSQWVFGKILKIDISDPELPWLVRRLDTSDDNYSDNYWRSANEIQKAPYQIIEIPYLKEL